MRSAQLTLQPIGVLARREVLRFYRQRSRIIGSLMTPFLFLLFLGTGLQSAFPGSRPASGANFMQYFFVANLVMTILFTSVFSAISLIEDRHEGFLQGVLVSPVSRWTIAVGKVLGATLVALGQGIIFLCLGPLLGISLSMASYLGMFLLLLCIALMLSSLGHYFAWKFDSVQGFHSVMNLLLFPMWILSGAFFPVESTPVWLKPLIYLNPLTYGVSGIKEIFFGSGFSSSVVLNMVVVLAFGIVFCGLLVGKMNQPQEVA